MKSDSTFDAGEFTYVALDPVLEASSATRATAMGGAL
jgi:hypothetical protein